MSIKIHNHNGNIKLYWSKINFSHDGDYYVATISRSDPYLTMDISILIKVHSNIFEEKNNYSKKAGNLKLEKNENGRFRIKYKFNLTDIKQSFKEEVNRQGQFIFHCNTTPIKTKEDKLNEYKNAKKRFDKLDRQKQSTLTIPPVKVFRGGLVSPK